MSVDKQCEYYITSWVLNKHSLCKCCPDLTLQDCIVIRILIPGVPVLGDTTGSKASIS